MISVRPFDLVSVDDYLARELASPEKHEYVDGHVYAMDGFTNLHNAIAGNAAMALHARLRGKACRACNSATKVRVRLPTHVRFYYPDVSVVCRPNPPTDSFQDEPAVVVEVLSDSTRRTDEGEKRDAYLTIPSLRVYLLVEQDGPLVVAYRQAGESFVREVYDGLDAIIPLTEVGVDLPLAEVYEAVDFPPPDPADD